ncbi:RagB/SusD family nutrient uptake outer membrane protein [Flammeovirga yaeyamensis]|uniref:RagB/SusD family nutrient uptake outer membrane protein n=1 Tax=Flammeovirga yaeyamensis TaxID=367791 RepID=A0AAX1N9Z7_9BACT|nr:RagB/SusD family nutrient uptake outer membrane protein [Flammeovirga yaeyamensis]MBB3699310.1 tetratricopeptide (TPR) repeat protein [Flammeovirga yaeyamensis]NMF35427.1 RagB/SusD family nutrient uptake outer membrane protein [Flammeovirga yaeyamensis]QWG04287.1 RagB/SusD family nutrient uptake outer membrane protein [Flammeovirga yaeyamensis]
MKYIRLLLIIITLSLSSCENYFDLERPPQNPWTTIDEFERVPIGLYASVYSGHHWNIPYVNYAIFKNSMGDDVNWVSDPSWGYWRNTKEHNTWSKRNFNLLYRTISSANNALEFIADNNGDPFPGASDENKRNNFDRIVGEIYFMRGMAYYYLQTFYGHAYSPSGNNNTPDLPLRLTYPNSLEEAKSPETGTTQQIFDLILSDFKKATELLPDKYLEGVHHQSYSVRANKFAAKAMLMKVHFSRGEYTDALSLCNEIIDQNGGEYDLSEDPIEAFNKVGLERGRETIFYIPFYDITLATPHHFSVINHTYENNLMCSWTENRMSNTLINKLNWLKTPNSILFNIEARRDKRFQQLMAVRYPADKASGNMDVDSRVEIQDVTTVWPFKYYKSAELFFTNVPLIRLGEIQLTRSILRFKNGDLTGSASDLNKVRQRSWDETVGGAFVEISTGDLTEDLIHTERMVEMFGEPDRVDYLRSLKMNIPPGDREGFATEPYDSESFVWAIPTEESIYNENL